MPDFLPRDARLRRPIVDPLLRPGGLNLLLKKEIEGALGFARQYHPKDPDSFPMAALSDMHRWGAAEPLLHWQNSLVVLAHEFGHALGLGHVPFVENVMFGGGTKRTSIELTLPQIATCRFRAAYLSGAVPLPTSGPGA